MRFSFGLDGAPSGDMALTVSNKSAWHAIGDRIAVITLWLNKTFSETGVVRLASADRRQEPEVDFNLLSDHRDPQRLAKGLRKIAGLHELPALKAVTSDVFAASFTDKIRRVDTYNTKNEIIASVGPSFMDGPALLRKFIIQRFIMESAGLNQALQDDEALETYIRRAAVGVWHCSCSCRMGEETDPMAVTDPGGRVHGVHGLRVVDASIFPVGTHAPIQTFPTMMVAERIADDILHSRA